MANGDAANWPPVPPIQPRGPSADPPSRLGGAGGPHAWPPASPFPAAALLGPCPREGGELGVPSVYLLPRDYNLQGGNGGAGVRFVKEQERPVPNRPREDGAGPGFRCPGRLTRWASPNVGNARPRPQIRFRQRRGGSQFAGSWGRKKGGASRAYLSPRLRKARGVQGPQPQERRPSSHTLDL